MGSLESEPKGTILLASIPWPRTIPERIFFEQLAHRSLLFENRDKGEKMGVRKVLVKKGILM